jgi:hypothetical protein
MEVRSTIQKIAIEHRRRYGYQEGESDSSGLVATDFLRLVPTPASSG